MTKAKSTSVSGIPLCLIPQAVARLIRDRGGKVYRISVVRMHFHHYNIPVRTRLLPRGLRVRENFPAPVLESAGDGGDKSGDDNGVIV